VEIPDLGFDSTRPFNAADLIAANVGAAHTIIPVQGYAADSLVWKGLRLGIQKDGEAFIEGLGSDVLGDPWQAVLWLANHYIERDYVLGKGQILITGAIGTMKQAEKGAYTFLMNDEAAFSFYLD
jgi:2-keto-4-pentenoate hydratase